MRINKTFAISCKINCRQQIMKQETVWDGWCSTKVFLSQYCTIYSDKRKRLEGHNFGQNNTMDGLVT